MKITPQMANQIYDILSADCAASGEWREHFIYSVAISNSSEYRFQGCLGFGGKFWNSSRRWYVNYYSEDKTPERDACVRNANLKLEALRRGDS